MERIQFGINGLDEMFGGGLIKNSICSLIGTYGTGKTTFALQFIFEGLRNGEKAIYFSLEEREDRIYDLMEERRFRVEKYRDESLFVIKLDPNDFNLSINSIKKDLPDLIKQIGFPSLKDSLTIRPSVGVRCSTSSNSSGIWTQHSS